MTVQVTFFGRLKDDLCCAELSIAWQGGNGRDLLASLRTRGEVWRAALADEKVFRLAVGQQLIKFDDYIQDGSHVAVLPPVTGG